MTPDPFADFILSLAYAADRAGYSPDEANEIAWLVLDATAVSREWGPYEDRPSLSRVAPRGQPAESSDVAALRNQVDEVLSAVLTLAREPSVDAPPAEEEAPSERLSNAELIERYVDHCRRRNLSPQTIRQWSSRLRMFSKATHKPFGAVTRQDVEAFLDRRDMAPETRNFWIISLKGFYRWAMEEELLEENPAARIHRPKLKHRTPRPMSDEDLARAIGEAGPVMRCWLLLGAYQGLRCQEIAGLKRDDVLESEGILRVVDGKGSKERLLPLHPDVLEALRDLPMPEQGVVFRRRRNLDRYPPYAVSQELNAYLRSLGIRSNAHSLRHWFASSMYRSTKDLRLTQELLGHSSPETTAVYAAFDTSTAGPAVRGLTID